MKNITFIHIPILGFLLTIFTTMFGQPIIHSHNDYFQNLPLYTAISSGANSVEIDVIYKDGQLRVAHDQRDLPLAKTIDELYFIPLVAMSKNPKIALKDVQLMIDVKNEPEKVMVALLSMIDGLPEFKQMLVSNNLKPLVISGSKPSSYLNWPAFILFDHQSLENLDKVPLDKVGFFSFSFRNFSKWNGKGRLTTEDEIALKNVINKVHALDKKIRFWATPDSKSAWYTMYDLGVDFINTDKPWECATYVKSLPNNIVKRDMKNANKALEAYQNQPIDNPSQNIILMVGDGNGLGHITAAYTHQFGNINLAKSKHVGLIHTSSYNDLTTDSAAGGSALACGQKTNNRHIGVNYIGQKMENFLEKLPKTYNKVILTTDEVTGATPSAFYAHVKERDDTKNIISDLVKSDINLIVGAGKRHFTDFDEKVHSNIVLHSKVPDNFINKKVNIAALENNELPYFNQGRGDFLTQSFTTITAQLERDTKPFFLVVENSHIDNSGHHNSAKDAISEVLDFDRCVGQAIEFVKKNPNTTLIVLADHETGGITLPHGNSTQMEFSFSTDDHTFLMVPVFAWGNNASIFQGMYQNTDIFHKIINILGLSK
jgi:alkaline phosphatase